MKNFYFKAKDNHSKIISGKIKALDAASAALQLERKGLIVLEITEDISDSSFGNSPDDLTKDLIFSIKEKKEFFNSFYHQYKSGLSVHDVFRTMSASASNKNVQAISYMVLRKIEKGHTLEEALAPFSKILGKEYTTIVCAGEKSGKLCEVLDSIVKNIIKEEDVKKNIISSLTYPACIFSLAMVIFLFFRMFVFKVFDKIGGDITQQEIFMMLFMTLFKIAVIILIFIGFVIYAVKNRKFKKKLIESFSKLPFISKISVNYYFQNFFTILALAYEAGVPVMDAVSLANGVMKNPGIRNKIHKSVKMISQGCEITTAFMVANVFSKFAISQTSAGEKAGELDKMLKTVAYDYEKKLELQINVITKILEPVMIILIGIFVVYILYTGYNKYYGGLLLNI